MDNNPKIAEFIKHYVLSFIVGVLVASMSYELHWTAWLNFPYPALAIVLFSALMVGLRYRQEHVAAKK